MSELPDAQQQQQQQQRMLSKAARIRRTLESVYPTAPKSFLHHSDPYTLLIAVLLSAQSLDAKVNQVTPQLFARADTPSKMLQLGEHSVRSIIKQIGLAPQKARNIVRLSHKLCELHDGRVPDTFEQLERLDGVGHKTASVVMMQAFDKPAFPVDTHIQRLACRWGCGNSKSVAKTEHNLKLWFPDPRSWAHLHMRLILFGREHCPARNHDMDSCPVCSFAATDEARQLNRQFPNKFVPAAKHADPFCVRAVEGGGVEQQSGGARDEKKQSAARGAKRRRTERGGGEKVAARKSSRLEQKRKQTRQQ